MWITPDGDSLQLTDKEQAIIAAHVASGGVAPVAHAVAVTVPLVRAYVRRAGIATDAAGTIPEELLGPFWAIVRWEALISLPSAKALQTDERKTAAETAWKQIEKLAGSVEPPETEDVVDAGRGVVPQITGRDRSYTRDTQDGI